MESRGPAAHRPVEGLLTDAWVAPHIPTVRGVRFLKSSKIKKQQEKNAMTVDTLMQMRLSEERSKKVKTDEKM